MKLILLMVVMLGFCKLGFTQSQKLSSEDSVRIELERATIAKELIGLRDSIGVTIVAFDDELKKTMPSAGVKLAAASKELKGYKVLVQSDIEEVAKTKGNSWNAESMERIHLATANTRREYKRICALL